MLRSTWQYVDLHPVRIVRYGLLYYEVTYASKIIDICSLDAIYTVDFADLSLHSHTFNSAKYQYEDL